MPFTFVMLPPHTDIARDWAQRLKKAIPEMKVVVPEGDNEAAVAIADADGAYGTPTAALLANAGKLRWWQAPMAAPPASMRSTRASGKTACKCSSTRCVPRPSGCRSTLPQVGQHTGTRSSRLQ